MSREDNGDYSPVEADEDVDPDVLIAEQERIQPRQKGRSARQRIEDLQESRDDE